MDELLGALDAAAQAGAAAQQRQRREGNGRATFHLPASSAYSSRAAAISAARWQVKGGPTIPFSPLPLLCRGPGLRSGIEGAK